VVELDAEYDGRDVPCPPHWGGIRIAPSTIEFWQGRRDRLHDRLVYRRESPTTAWSVVRLAP
jgi:pyridoxamine 5'-phosphate oxidase